MFGLSFGLSLSSTTGGGGTAAFTQFGVRPYFVMDTPKNKYLTSGPERSDNLSGLMTSVALGNATVIDKGGALKWRLHNFLAQSSDFSDAEWTEDSLEDAPALQADGSYLIVPASSGGAHRVVASIGTVTTTDQVTVVIEAKAAGYDYIAVALANSPFAGEVAAVWNVTTGVLVATSDGSVSTVEATAIKPTADGWGYEVTLKSTAGSAGVADVRIIISDDGTLDNFEGDGTSGVYIRKARAYYSSLGGMQLSSKDGTDYLPTAGAAGYALRRDYSRLPVDGQTLGEPAGVNLVRNNTMQGAAVGVLGSGGALPDNWVTSGTPTVEVVALGTEDGFPYIDVKYSGTPSGNMMLQLEGVAAIAANTGDKFSTSFNVTEIAGSQTNIDQFLFRQYEFDAGYLRNSSENFTLTTARSRIKLENVEVTDAAVTNVQPRIAMNWTSGDIDITIRYSATQMEEYHVATSVIPTYGAAEARAKDEASTVIADSIPGFIQGSGSIVFEGSVDYETGGSSFPAAVRIDNGGDSSQIPVFFAESTGAAFLNVTTAWASQSNVGNVPVASGEIFRSAGRWDANDIAFSADGSAAGQDTSGTIDSNMTHIRLGDDSGVQRPIRISHFSIGPYASPVASPGWSNAQLAVISGS
jgi:hypothetical protein